MAITNIKSLERAGKLLKQVKKIDRDIIQIEKIARYIVDTPAEITVDIKIGQNDKPTGEGRLFPFNMEAPAALIQRLNWWLDEGGPVSTNAEKEDPVPTNSSFDISEGDCLRVLAAILEVKYAEREKLLDQINKLGVNI